MLNHAARYFPILREMRRVIGIRKHSRVLEVGSGTIGLGEYYPYPFVGTDISFSGPPRAPMLAVKCSGSHLPFADESFDAVVASDVMEHVPPEWRQPVVREVLRVSRGLAIFGYPSGDAAFDVDKRLREQFIGKGLEPPVWLEEHMMHPFPGRELFSELPAGWTLQEFPNEGVSFHYWMMCIEMYRPLDYLFRLALLAVPQVIEWFLTRMDSEPSYRRIFVLSRR